MADEHFNRSTKLVVNHVADIIKEKIMLKLPTQVTKVNGKIKREMAVYTKKQVDKSIHEFVAAERRIWEKLGIDFGHLNEFTNKTYTLRDLTGYDIIYNGIKIGGRNSIRYQGGLNQQSALEKKFALHYDKYEENDFGWSLYNEQEKPIKSHYGFYMFGDEKNKMANTENLLIGEKRHIGHVVLLLFTDASYAYDVDNIKGKRRTTEKETASGKVLPIGGLYKGTGWYRSYCQDVIKAFYTAFFGTKQKEKRYQTYPHTKPGEIPTIMEGTTTTREENAFFAHKRSTQNFKYYGDPKKLFRKYSTFKFGKASERVIGAPGTFKTIKVSLEKARHYGENIRNETPNNSFDMGLDDSFSAENNYGIDLSGSEYDDPF